MCNFHGEIKKIKSLEILTVISGLIIHNFRIIHLSNVKFREDYSFYDLEAGCCHLGIEHEDVTFKRQELNISPLSLLETGKVDLSPLTKYNYGFGKNLKKEEIIIVLNEIIKEGLEYWEEMVSIDSFSPVVIIDNELCDGFHRCVLAYILGIEVIASYYETSYNQ